MVAERIPEVVTEEDFRTAIFCLQRLTNWLYYADQAQQAYLRTEIYAHKVHSEYCLTEAKRALKDLYDRTTPEALEQAVLFLAERGIPQRIKRE